MSRLLVAAVVVVAVLVYMASPAWLWWTLLAVLVLLKAFRFGRAFRAWRRCR